ncbi:hypothetical protein G6F40_015458 [Rhizopus arrhizus]|nr:hypothetical protein G6F40_015458 [Rhizopus arrhizus]
MVEARRSRPGHQQLAAGAQRGRWRARQRQPCCTGTGDAELVRRGRLLAGGQAAGARRTDLPAGLDVGSEHSAPDVRAGRPAHGRLVPVAGRPARGCPNPAAGGDPHRQAAGAGRPQGHYAATGTVGPAATAGCAPLRIAAAGGG